MYKVEFFDNNTEESHEILVFDLEELSKLLDYIRFHSERFELFSIHQEYCCIGFDNFLTCIEGEDKNNIITK